MKKIEASEIRKGDRLTVKYTYGDTILTVEGVANLLVWGGWKTEENIYLTGYAWDEEIFREQKALPTSAGSIISYKIGDVSCIAMLLDGGRLWRAVDLWTNDSFTTEDTTFLKNTNWTLVREGKGN